MPKLGGDPPLRKPITGSAGCCALASSRARSTTGPAGIHRHNLLSFGILSGSYLNRAVDSFVLFPLTRIVNVLSRPSSLFLFPSVRMSSFRLNRKTDTDDDGSIEVATKGTLGKVYYR